MFMEVKGGWIRVDDWRVQRGPREGKRFITYDDIMKIKAERSAKGTSPPRSGPDYPQLGPA